MDIRPAPTPEQQAAAEERIDWDRPVGYSHASAILALLPKTEETQKFTN